MSRTSLTKGSSNDSYPYVCMNKATWVMCRTSEQEYKNILLISQTLQVAFDIYLKYLGYSSKPTLHFVGAISAVAKYMIFQTLCWQFDESMELSRSTQNRKVPKCD